MLIYFHSQVDPKIKLLDRLISFREHNNPYPVAVKVCLKDRCKEMGWLTALIICSCFIFMKHETVSRRFLAAVLNALQHKHHIKLGVSQGDWLENL